jgi:hypothetical protein
MWFAEVLSGLAHSLTLGGNFDEAEGVLEEANAAACELGNQNLMAQVMRFRADWLAYTGDIERAHHTAAQAVDAAEKSSDSSALLLARATAARLESAVPSDAIVSTLAHLARDAEARGLNSLAVECSIVRADVMLRLGQTDDAMNAVDRAIVKAESLGLQYLRIAAHHVRAEALRRTGDVHARREYALGLQLLNTIRQEEGNQNIVARPDISKLYSECEQWSTVPSP